MTSELDHIANQKAQARRKGGAAQKVGGGVAGGTIALGAALLLVPGINLFVLIVVGSAVLTAGGGTAVCGTILEHQALTDLERNEVKLKRDLAMLNEQIPYVEKQIGDVDHKLTQLREELLARSRSVGTSAPLPALEKKPDDDKNNTR